MISYQRSRTRSKLATLAGFILLLLLAQTTDAVLTSPDTDILVTLIETYDLTNKLTWKTTDAPLACNMWSEHVSCDASETILTGLTLDSVPLNGRWVPDFLNFPNLGAFSAVSARLTGPMLVDNNPFSKLTKVNVLDNQLEGSVPASLLTLATSLQYLNLGKNLFLGDVPAFSLSSLSTLSLLENHDLTNFEPNWFTDALVELDVTGNFQMQGQVPDTIDPILMPLRKLKLNGASRVDICPPSLVVRTVFSAGDCDLRGIDHSIYCGKTSCIGAWADAGCELDICPSPPVAPPALPPTTPPVASPVRPPSPPPVTPPPPVSPPTVPPMTTPPVSVPITPPVATPSVPVSPPVTAPVLPPTIPPRASSPIVVPVTPPVQSPVQTPIELPPPTASAPPPPLEEPFALSLPVEPPTEGVVVECGGTRPSEDFVCNNGQWIFNGSVSVPEINIGAGVVIVQGDLNVTSVITFSGLQGSVVVQGCVEISGAVQIELSADDLDTLNKEKTKDGRTRQLIQQDSRCSTDSLLSIPVTVKNDAKSCRTASAKSQTDSQASFNVLFSLDSKKCNRWWIITVSVIASVLVLTTLAVGAFLIIKKKASTRSARRFSHA